MVHSQALGHMPLYGSHASLVHGEFNPAVPTTLENIAYDNVCWVVSDSLTGMYRGLQVLGVAPLDRYEIILLITIVALNFWLFLYTKP